jgi:hypothetical protein
VSKRQGTRLYHHSSTTDGHFYAALISGTGTKLSSLTNHARLTGKIPSWFRWFDTNMTGFPSLMVVLTTLWPWSPTLDSQISRSCKIPRVGHELIFGSLIQGRASTDEASTDCVCCPIYRRVSLASGGHKNDVLCISLGSLRSWYIRFRARLQCRRWESAERKRIS